MPIPLQAEILIAIKNLIAAVDDTGLVLTRERSIESDAELPNLFVGLNQGRMHGWLIRCAGFTQERVGETCDVDRSLRYELISIYPFQDRTFDGGDSHDKFRTMIEAVNSVMMAEAMRGLGLDGSGFVIEHKLLQAVEDFSIEQMSQGGDTYLVHFARFELVVSLLITV